MTVNQWGEASRGKLHGSLYQPNLKFSKYVASLSRSNQTEESFEFGTGHGTWKKYLKTLGLTQGNLKYSLWDKHTETAEHMLLSVKHWSRRDFLSLV